MRGRILPFLRSLHHNALLETMLLVLEKIIRWGAPCLIPVGILCSNSVCSRMHARDFHYQSFTLQLTRVTICWWMGASSTFICSRNVSSRLWNAGYILTMRHPIVLEIMIYFAVTFPSRDVIRFHTNPITWDEEFLTAIWVWWSSYSSFY